MRDIKTAIAEVRATYHELVLGSHRESTCAAVAGLTDGNRTLTPHVIDRATYDRAMRAAEVVTRALDVATRRLLVDETLRRELGLGPHFDTFIALDGAAGGVSIASRLDAFIDPDGVARFIEINSVDPRGSPLFARTHAQLPITHELARRFPITPVGPYEGAREAIVDAQVRRGGSRTPVVAVQERPASLKPIEGPWLPDVAFESGWTVVPLELDHLTFHDGVLRVRDIAIDLVEIDFGDLIAAPPTLTTLVDAVRAGAVRFSFAAAHGMIAHYKNVFEMLTDPEHAAMFDAETNRVLAEAVPWTRIVRDRKTTYRGHEIDLLPYISAHRERFVIKPSGGASGAGVVLGWDCTDAAWQRALKIARVVQSVVQESAPHPAAETYMFLDPHDAPAEDVFTADFDPFVWNVHRASGAISRIARSGLHNTGAGAWLAPLWVLEP